MKRVIFLSAFILVICSCRSDDDAQSTAPGIATLIFPDNAQECNQGVSINALESKVTFKWGSAINADSYVISLKNLNLQTTVNLTTATNNQLDITINKATPYSWFVTSKNSVTNETSVSATWKFYNAGDATTSYAPFPAEVIKPAMGLNVSDITSQTLEWAGADVDNDILDYDVYFGTVTPPVNLEATTTNTSINVTVASGNIYYWKVITKDSEAHHSESQIFEFKVD